jgi:uncharacterized membrane protein
MTIWSRFSAVVSVLAVAGIAVAALLTSFHYVKATERLFCSGVGGCETVNTGVYSTIGRVPVAVLGLAAYATILAIVLASRRSAVMRRRAPLLVFALSLVGVLYSAYLTYLELYVIRAICPWCVVSAVLMTLIFLVTTAELRSRARAPAAVRAA